MNLFKSVFLVGAFSACVLFANGQAAAHLKHHHPLPLSLFNVKAGTSNEAMVISMYGIGLTDTSDVHGTARYFTDETKKIIFKTITGNNDMIDEVAVCSYKLPFEYVKDKLALIPVAKKLNIQSMMMGNIHIGDRQDKIGLQFGSPNKSEKIKDIRVLTFEDTNDEWKEIKRYSATFEFKEERLERIIIDNQQ